MSAENPSVSSPPGALAGVRVLDLATLFAGPMAATILGDFGADVIKVEHPTKGDPVRNHGPSKNGIPLWWAMLSRNKRTIALYLGDPRGAEIAKKLGISAATFNGYKAKDFVFDPKPKGRKKKE